MLLAKRLAVTSDDTASIEAYLALALLANDRFDEAISQARLAVTGFTPDSGVIGEIPWLAMIAAEALAGHEGEAQADLQRFLSTLRTLKTLAAVQMKAPAVRAVPQAMDGLQRAGMPSE